MSDTLLTTVGFGNILIQNICSVQRGLDSIWSVKVRRKQEAMKVTACYKVYVDVSVLFLSDGQMIPRKVRWYDGRIFEIDKVKYTDLVTCSGGCKEGICYTVMIQGKECRLFYEENLRWYVEAKKPVSEGLRC